MIVDIFLDDFKRCAATCDAGVARAPEVIAPEFFAKLMSEVAAQYEARFSFELPDEIGDGQFRGQMTNKWT